MKLEECQKTIVGHLFACALMISLWIIANWYEKERRLKTAGIF